MSRLLIDLGNSRLKWALATAGSMSTPAAIEHANNAIPLPEQLDTAWSEMAPPEQVWLASVAAEPVGAAVCAWIGEHWQRVPERAVARERQCGVVNAYRIPAQLGIDRWLALLAARADARGPVCAIDCGTAITVDALDGAGRHQGGIIVPGLHALQDALIGQTGLRADSGCGERPLALLADQTQAALAAGAYIAAVAAIDRITADIELELGQPLQRLITGGDASSLLPLLAAPCRHVPELVLKGLLCYAEDLQPQAKRPRRSRPRGSRPSAVRSSTKTAQSVPEHSN